MRKPLLSLLFLAGSMTLFAQENPGATAPELNTSNDSMSYFLGLSLGYDLQNLPFEIDPALMIEGLNGALNGTAGYDPQTTQAIFRQFQEELQEKEAARQEQIAMEAMGRASEYLEEVAGREGVIQTPSGLMYEVLEEGEGPYPADTSTVTVHYEGRLTDGTVFDSSYDRGEPATFPLNRVIRGWTEGVQLMPLGSTYRFYIPPELGYGPRGTGSIPGYAVLVFKIELQAIEE